MLNHLLYKTRMSESLIFFQFWSDFDGVLITLYVITLIKIKTVHMEIKLKSHTLNLPLTLCIAVLGNFLAVHQRVV